MLQSVCMLKTAYKFFICFEFAFIICVHLCLLKYRISIAKTGANGRSDEFRDRQKNERSRSGNPYSSHVKAGKHAGTVYNFKRKSRIRKSLTRLPILLEFIHKYIFLNFVSFYNGLNSNFQLTLSNFAEYQPIFRKINSYIALNISFTALNGTK